MRLPASSNPAYAHHMTTEVLSHRSRILTLSSSLLDTRFKSCTSPDMLSLLLLTLLTLATAYVLPSAAPSTKSQLSLEYTCTFTLLHRQQSSFNYIQLNEIVDHANEITIDVASQRPDTTFNSYTRLDSSHAFAVAGLLDEERMTITSNGDDVLSFEVGEVRWDTAESRNGEGCSAGEWAHSGRNRVSSNVLVRKMVWLTRCRNARCTVRSHVRRRLMRLKRIGLQRLQRMSSRGLQCSEYLHNQ